MAGQEKNCKWYFADQPNDREVGPNNAMEQSFRSRPYASLVRESIQNSLDAVLDKSKPVRMVFSIMEIHGSDYPEFFELSQHIKGCLDYFPKNHNAKVIYEPMCRRFSSGGYNEHLGFIRVSDYNTKGMHYEDGNTVSPFYAFVRSAGVDVKADTSAGGSFGFGKAAYYLLSPISTILVSTCTDTYEKYFEGASSLCTHLFNGEKKVAFGFYDDRNGKPIMDEKDIPVQFRRSEPGTDINIMGFDVKYTDEAVTEMTEAVLRNFWMAILNGKLEVAINGSVSINQNNIADLMDQYFEDEDDNTRKSGYYNPKPYFNAVRLSGSSGKFLCFEDTLPLLDHVCFYVSKKKGATDKYAYMRLPQMLVNTKKTRTNYGMYGVFYCDSEKGNEILRNMEPPSHDEWRANNWRVNGRVFGLGRVALKEMDDFISECMSKTFSLKDKIAIDIKGLEDFLYIPTSYEENDDLNSESQVGKPTGDLQEDGSSATTDISNGEENPTINNDSGQSSTGQVIVSGPSSNSGSSTGRGHTGRGSRTGSRGTSRGKREKDEDGEDGMYTIPIDVSYRAFSQEENGRIYHYVVLHPDEEVGNISLRFIAAGDEGEEDLRIAETNVGKICGNTIRGIYLGESRLRLRVRFTDNMKHALKLLVEVENEI